MLADDTMTTVNTTVLGSDGITTSHGWKHVKPHYDQ